MSKLLLFGFEVEKDLYDWKKNTITNDLKCDKQSYIQLINLCFQSDITTPIITSFIRSISLYDFMDLQNIQLDEKLNSDELLEKFNVTINPID